MLTHTLRHTLMHVNNSREEDAGRQLARLKIQQVKQSVVEPEKTKYSNSGKNKQLLQEKLGTIQ